MNLHRERAGYRHPNCYFPMPGLPVDGIVTYPWGQVESQGFTLVSVTATEPPSLIPARSKRRAALDVVILLPVAALGFVSLLILGVNPAMPLWAGVFAAVIVACQVVFNDRMLRQWNARQGPFSAPRAPRDRAIASWGPSDQTELGNAAGLYDDLTVIARHIAWNILDPHMIAWRVVDDPAAVAQARGALRGLVADCRAVDDAESGLTFAAREVARRDESFAPEANEAGTS